MGPRLRRGDAIRVVVALALTIGPALAIGYLGFRTVAERERTLGITHTATATLVRDRLVSEMDALEASVFARASAPTESADIPSLQQWLRQFESANPWAGHVSLAGPAGRVTTPTLWKGWRQPALEADIADPSAVSLREAERLEFMSRDLPSALLAYRRSLTSATTPEAKARARLRVARTLVNLGRFDDGIEAYRLLLPPADAVSDLQGHPYPVIALDGIREAFARAGRSSDRDGAARDLLAYILANPWDVDDGYGYYLRLATRAYTGTDLAAATTERMEALAEIENAAEARLIVPGHQTGPFQVRFTIREDFLRDSMLARIVGGVNLGSDLRVDLADRTSPPSVSLASVEIGERMPGWTVRVVDVRGHSLQQRSTRERWTYGVILALILAVLVVGVVFMTRAWAREAELSRARTDFVSNVSHELKTPLALIRMFGETLESGVVEDPARRKEFSSIIRRESERLTHLINNVLDTAKIEAGTKQFEFHDADIVALVREALEAYSPLFDRLSFSVQTALPEAPLAARVDRDAVAQALVNLFQNAIRYSDVTRHVAVSVSQAASDVVVSVADRGVGIPPDDLPRIFDKFYRGRSQDSPAGSGLGLSIVRHVMQAHGGRVDVRSVVGQGSTFDLVFPWTGSAAS